MPKTAKVKHATWESVDGVLCAIVHADDGSSIAVPAVTFKFLNAEARRRLLADKQSQMPPRWHQMNFLLSQTMMVSITDEGNVGIILDPNTETEFSLSFTPEHAAELGRQLIATADQTTGTPPKIN